MAAVVFLWNKTHESSAGFCTDEQIDTQTQIHERMQLFLKVAIAYEFAVLGKDTFKSNALQYCFTP